MGSVVLAPPSFSSQLHRWLRNCVKTGAVTDRSPTQGPYSSATPATGRPRGRVEASIGGEHPFLPSAQRESPSSPEPPCERRPDPAKPHQAHRPIARPTDPPHTNRHTMKPTHQRNRRTQSTLLHRTTQRTPHSIPSFEPPPPQRCAPEKAQRRPRMAAVVVQFSNPAPRAGAPRIRPSPRTETEWPLPPPGHSAR